MELGEPDASGRRRPVPVEGSEFVLECDAIIPAIGQICVVDCVIPPEEEGFELTRWKTLVVDDMTFQSGRKHVFGGGDCITGPATLIAALAHGKKAAKYIVQYLEKGECQPDVPDYMEKLIEHIGVFNYREKMPYKGNDPRMQIKAIEPEERIKSFEEVESAYNTAEAIQEASRCLRCYRIGMVAF
jgi:formate dehydrogenase beta subunit